MGSPFVLGQAAQHDGFDTSRLNAWAARRRLLGSRWPGFFWSPVRLLR
ncbi:MAG TPA: hypothetical protein VF933_27020 [Streptosporangiaceae bacterium]